MSNKFNFVYIILKLNYIKLRKTPLLCFWADIIYYYIFLKNIVINHLTFRHDERYSNITQLLFFVQP